MAVANRHCQTKSTKKLDENIPGRLSEKMYNDDADDVGGDGGGTEALACFGAIKKVQ